MNKLYVDKYPYTLSALDFKNVAEKIMEI